MNVACRSKSVKRYVYKVWSNNLNVLFLVYTWLIVYFQVNKHLIKITYILLWNKTLLQMDKKLKSQKTCFSGFVQIILWSIFYKPFITVAQKNSSIKCRKNRKTKAHDLYLMILSQYNNSNYSNIFLENSSLQADWNGYRGR